MTFSGLSVGLWATLLASLVGAVTLMYLMRMRRRRVEVPFGPLWQKVLKEHRSSRLFRVLRRLFSLLVQCVVLALLVTALADPDWTGDWTLDTHSASTDFEGRHVLLVVDVSASMAATDVLGGRFDRGREAANRVLDDLVAGDRVRLATFSRDTVAQTDWTEDIAQVRTVLSQLKPEDTGTNPASFLQFARYTMHGLDKPSVVLVTDRAFAPLATEQINALNLSVVDTGVADSSDNIAVLDFKVRPHLGNRLQHALYYKLKNYGRHAVDVAVYLHEDEEGSARTWSDFAAQSVTTVPVHHHLQAGEERVFERNVSDLRASRVALQVQPKADADFVDVFATDDVAFATVEQRKAVRVQLVGKSNLFLQAALQTSNQVEVITVSPEEYTGGEGFDLTVFDSQSAPIPASGNAVYVNVQQGDVPFRVRGQVEGGLLRVPGSVKQHPLMRFVKFVDLEAESIQRFRPQKGDRIMTRDRRGRPAILAHSDAKSRWIAIGFDPVATEWVGHYSFSIFFANAINWFFAEDVRMQPVQSLAKEWTVRLPWGTDSVRVTTPRGDELSALVDARGSLAYTGRDAGFYPVVSTKSSSQSLVVAASLTDGAESTVGAQGTYPLWAPRTAVEPPKSGMIASASLWKILVFLAMFILLIEWFTYHRRWTA